MEQACAAFPKTSSAVAVGVASGVELFRLGTRELMFSPAKQVLMDLSEPAALLMEVARHTAAYDNLVAALVAKGLHASAASAYATRWIAEGCESGVIEARLTRDVHGPTRVFSVGGFCVELTFEDEQLRRHCCGGYDALPETSAPGLSIGVARVGSHALICSESAHAQLVPMEVVATRLRHTILTSILRRTSNPALHAACLTSRNGAVLICGSPGAGKSTLALALLQAGWGYGGDDVVLVDEQGHTRGLPLPLTLKQGAWSIANRWIPLTQAPPLRREDGVSLRYWPVIPDPSPWTPVRALVRLDRQDAGRHELASWDPLIALQHLFAEAYSSSGVARAEDVGGLVSLVEKAECLTLSYSDALSAARALSKRYGVQA